MKLQVGLYDSLFSHALAIGNGDLGISPAYISFDRSSDLHNITFFTDLDLDKANSHRGLIKVAWIIECKDVHPEVYKRIIDPDVYKIFDLILTHDKELLAVDNRFVFTSFGGCWVDPPHQRVYAKSKNLSIIASDKHDLEGHQLRHQIVRTYREKIDGLFGRGYQEIKSKLDGLKEFRYSIVVENTRRDYWFTEKLIDCFATGTVPIYWGCPSIGRFFDMDGLIQFSSIEELESILPTLSSEDYRRRLPSIMRNFELFKEYAVTEDYMFTKVIQKHRVFKTYLEPTNE